MNPENNDEKKEFAAVMVALANEMGANIEGRKNLLKLKYEALLEYDLLDLRRGVTWLIKNRTQTFPPMPTVREIIDAIKIVTDVPDTKSLANIECDKVLYFLKKYGNSEVFKGSVLPTKYLMENVWKYNSGWASTVKEDDLKWFRKEFVDRWIKMNDDPAVNNLISNGSVKKSIGLDIKQIS